MGDERSGDKGGMDGTVKPLAPRFPRLEVSRMGRLSKIERFFLGVVIVGGSLLVVVQLVYYVFYLPVGGAMFSWHHVGH